MAQNIERTSQLRQKRTATGTAATCCSAPCLYLPLLPAVSSPYLSYSSSPSPVLPLIIYYVLSLFLPTICLPTALLLLSFCSAVALPVPIAYQFCVPVCPCASVSPSYSLPPCLLYSVSLLPVSLSLLLPLLCYPSIASPLSFSLALLPSSSIYGKLQHVQCKPHQQGKKTAVSTHDGLNCGAKTARTARKLDIRALAVELVEPCVEPCVEPELCAQCQDSLTSSC